MKKLFMSFVAALGMTLFLSIPSMACTSYYVGSECTADGSTMYGRTEDTSEDWAKVFKIIEAKEVGENAMYVDPTGATNFQAPIKVTTTYRYSIYRDAEAFEDGFFGEVGQNEMGVSMSATTSASPSKAVRQFDGFVRGTGITEENLTDYVLCQAATAREGVELLRDVVATIGAGQGNGLFIADNTEVWYVEILTGHNMCAVKMPADKAAIIPNCFVIDEVDTEDTENVICTETLVSLAKDNGFFVAAKEGTINVKASYAPSYSAGNADRIRGGEYLLSGVDCGADIYDVAWRDMFFDCEDITVEKMYELAGYRYEGFEPEDFKHSREIGVNATVEAHIMQISSDMPKELATVQWQSMKSPAYTTFVPFYTAVMTDTPDSYKIEAGMEDDEVILNEESAFCTYYDLYNIANENQDTVGVAVKAAWKNYMTIMEKQQKKVNDQMLRIYKNHPENLEYYATELGKQIAEDTRAYAMTMLAEAQDYVANNSDNSVPFVTSVNFKDLSYKTANVQPPKSQKGKENNNGKKK